MIERIWFGAVGAVLVMQTGSQAYAQSATVVAVEATTDETRRGLSWSDGKASVSGDISTRIGPVEASARVAALREAARHGDSDAVADLSLGTRFDVSALTLGLKATGYVFAGGGGPLNYAEVSGSAGYTYGPVQFELVAAYAPEQSAIGGDNLYLRAEAIAGIPSTPFTVVAALGRSSGSDDGSGRSNRVRPGGDYSDWRLGVDYVRRPLVLTVEYVGTDTNENAFLPGRYDARHDGDRVLGRVRYAF